MVEKHKKIVLTIKQKLKLIEKFENGESATKLAKDYGIGIQTIRDIKNNKMQLMEFVRDCDSSAGPSGCKCMTKSSYEEVDVAL
jgi:DNA invertase Pin-like site-specific DNA recombinase